ncbi:MAG: hypothetical protein RLP15_00425 [Cryomorphaceae bacterium]
MRDEFADKSYKGIQVSDIRGDSYGYEHGTPHFVHKMDHFRAVFVVKPMFFCP